MVQDAVRRRLSAILAADVVGYSRLMGRDEAGTLAALKERRTEVLNPLIARHCGRLVKVMGDGVLVEFSSAVAAVECAIGLQAAFGAANRSLPEKSQIILRIGINLGDVIVEDGDLYGDGVNLASRLEKLADAGSIYVSQSVYDQVKRKLNATFDDLGAQSLKNIPDPVVVYRVRQEPLGQVADRLSLPTKPSIAVLPFTSMSPDPTEETFADGLTEDLITDLSRHSGLFVIARNSTFAYKGKSLDARRIAGELGVRYLLEGSARRAAGRVRINVQLIDSLDGVHLWAERFDRVIEDVFAVQDEVTAKIVEALVGRLTTPTTRVRPKNMEAYELCVRARVLHEESPQAAHEGLILLQRAIALDPDYAEAHAWLALNHWLGWAHWGRAPDPYRGLALATAEKAVQLDPSHAGCRWILGMILAYEGRGPESEAQFVTALDLDPNHADAWAELSDLTVLKGQHEAGLEHILKAFRLNPYPPSWYFLLLGQAQYAMRQYQSAIETLRRPETYRTMSRRLLAASLAQSGQLEEAQREAEMFLVSNSHFTISQWAAINNFRDPATCNHFVQGFRKAGLPE